jgi:hypothetical protein
MGNVELGDCEDRVSKLEEWRTPGKCDGCKKSDEKRQDEGRADRGAVGNGGSVTTSRRRKRAE